MGAPAIILSGVRKCFGDFCAVDNLDLRVETGQIFGLLGPNGAGKSTTLRMINDIIAPDRGTIRLFGELEPGADAALHIGYLPEERGLYPKMRVAELLQFFAQLRGVGRRASAQRASMWLERLGLEEWSKNRIQDLSKGMQQKVQFATALIHEPELLILDEPWSGLDPINADVLKDIVVEQRNAGRTVVISTHLMEQAEKLVDRVCIIARGKKVLDGGLDEIKRQAAPEGLIAIEFADPGSLAVAEAKVFSDPALISSRRQRQDYIEVQLCAGVSSDRLLSAFLAEKCAIRRFEHAEPSLHQLFVDRVSHGEADVR